MGKKDKNNGGNATKKRKGFGVGKITALAIAVALALGVFSWYQVVRYGDNVIEIYADQQDTYVQLVLDQINLVSNRSADDMVRDILSTIDGSSSEYWTLSKGDSLVFVKDIAESYRYRGFTTDTYYDTASAKRFIEDLVTNQVSHAIIEIDGRKFIISGVAFAYGGATYRMCLLTSEHMVIDNNAYLTARVNLGIAIALALIAMLMTALLVGLRGDKWKRRAYETEDDNVQLRNMVERLNQQLSQQNLYDTRNAVYGEQAAAMLFEKLIQRRQTPTTFVYLGFENADDEDEFLRECMVFFDNRVLRFRLEDGLVLAFLGYTAKDAQAKLELLTSTPTQVRPPLTMGSGDSSSWERLRGILLYSDDDSNEGPNA